MGNYGNNPDFIYAKSQRKRFEALKRTPEFKKWKKRQAWVQKQKCAWCRGPLKDETVHVDHALPLYQGGTNKYSNLVLSHASCNMEKWIRIDGRPSWIEVADRSAEKTEKLLPIRREQAKIKHELVAAELDERLLNGELSWLMQV